MTKEEIEIAEAQAKAEEEAKAKTDAEAAKKSKEEEGGEEKGTLTTIDYKAELEKEKKARADAEALIAANKFRSSHKKDDEGKEGKPDDEDNKPVTRKDLAIALESNQQRISKEANVERVSIIADEIADSPEEAELIAEIYKNRQFPSHLSLREQIEESHAIANRKKITSVNSELTRALKAKGNASKDAAGTMRDGQQGVKPNMSANDENAYKRAGFVYDTASRIWTKKLPNGKTLCKDPKSKATYVK